MLLKLKTGFQNNKTIKIKFQNMKQLFFKYLDAEISMKIKKM